MWRNGWRTVAIVSVSLLAGTWVQSAIASSPQTAIKSNSGPVSSLQVASDSGGSESTSDNWTDIPGARIVVKVPGNWRTAMVVSTFSGECTGNADVRLMMDGVQMGPSEGGGGRALDYFCNGPFLNSLGSPLTKWVGGLTPGRHVLTAQFQGGTPQNPDTIGVWTLTAMKARSS